MIAPLPTYEIRDRDDRLVAETIGYDAAIAAAEYLLESGEEPGPLRTHYAGREAILETFRIGAAGWRVKVTTTQGLRETLR